MNEATKNLREAWELVTTMLETFSEQAGLTTVRVWLVNNKQSKQKNGLDYSSNTHKKSYKMCSESNLPRNLCLCRYVTVIRRATHAKLT